VRKLLKHKEMPATAAKELDPDIRHLQDKLSQTLGAKVQIQHTTKGKGKVVLNYNSLEELDGILRHIN
jgi:ParB family chromosome partitioning protein